MKKLFLFALLAIAGIAPLSADDQNKTDYVWFKCDDGFIYSDELDAPDGLSEEAIQAYIKELKEKICD